MSSLAAQPAAKTIPARQASLPPLPSAPAEGAPGCLRPYLNERLNSRLSRPLPAGKWTSAWTVPVAAGLMPHTVLCSGQHALILGQTAFQLFVRARLAAHAARMGEDAQILPAEGIFLQPDRYSRIATYALLTGATDGYFTADGGNDTVRTFIHRGKGHTVVASVDESRSPHNPVPTPIGYLEVFDAEGRQTASRELESGRLRVALHKAFIILARPNAIDFLDTSLNAQRRIELAMTPQGLSLDESGRAYVLGTTGNQQTLWIITPTGEYVAAPLPTGSAAFHRPPVVGYDHRVYLLSLSKIQTIDAEGKQGWTYEAPARVAGATVTTDGHLLTATGDTIVALNPQGEPQTLCHTENEQLMASPILGSRGELYALTDRRLHCFTAA